MVNPGFTVVKESSKSLARRGVYSFGNGSNVKSIQTPAYIMPTSRGVVPHLTPDHIEGHTDFSGLFVAAEDCK